MSVADRQRKVDALVATVPEVLRPVFGADSCILASAIGQTLLREVGISTKLLPCRCIAYNAAMQTEIDGDLDRLFESWSDEEEEAAAEAGAWAVMIGWQYRDQDTSQRFVGHAVLTMRNPDVLIDLTLDQAARDDRLIDVEPYAFPMPRDGMTGFERGDLIARYEADNGTWIAYIPAPDLVDDLRAAPDLARPTGEHRAVYGAAERRCREKFQEALR